MRRTPIPPPSRVTLNDQVLNNAAMVDLNYPARVYGRNIIIADPDATADLEERQRAALEHVLQNRQHPHYQRLASLVRLGVIDRPEIV